MNTALKLKPTLEEPTTLSEIPPLDKNRSHLKLVWENPSVSACLHREKPKAKLRLVSGQTLFGYVLQNPVNLVDPLGLWTAQSFFSANLQAAGNSVQNSVSTFVQNNTPSQSSVATALGNYSQQAGALGSLTAYYVPGGQIPGAILAGTGVLAGGIQQMISPNLTGLAFDLMVDGGTGNMSPLLGIPLNEGIKAIGRQCF